MTSLAEPDAPIAVGTAVHPVSRLRFAVAVTALATGGFAIGTTEFVTMGLLPAMRAQGFGHVVNVVSWGVQIKAPKFSAYLASKSAIDTWGRILAREARSDGVHVTNMRFGLVKTPMIAPTKEYENQRAMTAEQAGQQVLRIMEDLPPAWGHPVGYVGEAMGPSVSNMTRTVMTFAAFRPSYRSLTMARPTTMPALAPMA